MKQILYLFFLRVHKRVHYVICFLSNMALGFVGNTLKTIVGGAKLYFTSLFMPVLREDVLKGQPLSIFAHLFPGTSGHFSEILSVDLTC